MTLKDHFLIFLSVFTGVILGLLAKDYIEARLLLANLDEFEYPAVLIPQSENRTANNNTHSNTFEPSSKKRSSGYVTALQTCEFWRTQYRDDPLPKYKVLRDAACARAASLK